MNVSLRTYSARQQTQLAVEPFKTSSCPDGSQWAHFYRLDSGYLIRFPQRADFEVRADGTAACVWPVPGVSLGTIEHLHLNQVVPLALSRQGRLMLHASAVEIGCCGVAFIGESGRGKSTLATSFATSGSRFLTDDGLQLQRVNGQHQIQPSHPSLRLWQDSQDALVSSNAALAASVDYSSKVRMLAGGDIAYCDEPRPLRRIFYLGQGTSDEPTIEPMRPLTAMIELARSSFLLDVEEQQMLTLHFGDISRLAELPIHFRLDYPRRYECLTAVRDAIIQHVTDNEQKPAT